MDEKAQTSFEYLLLLAGILSVIIAVTMLIRGNVIPGGEQQINSSYTNYLNATNTSGMV